MQSESLVHVIDDDEAIRQSLEFLLQTARMAGLRAPSSCEIGSCGTCMAQLTHGSARMINNDALDPDEVEEGWVLTCQALPTSPTVRVVYE